MTTTAAAWRHIWQDGDACMGHEGKFLCGCTTPTPDADSPCDQISDPDGMDDISQEDSRYCKTHDYDEGPADMPCAGRCTCGHSLEKQ